MNAPFKSPPAGTILATACVAISELKKNPATVIAEAQKRQVAILNRNKPVAYVIAPHVWEYLCDLVDDMKDAELAREALADTDEVIEVSIDELSTGIRSSSGEIVE